MPTIYPPSTVNRGESIRVRPPEPERKARPVQSSPVDFFNAPKKRGPKPKMRFPVNAPGSAETFHSRADQHLPLSHKMGETSNYGFMQQFRRVDVQNQLSRNSLYSAGPPADEDCLSPEPPEEDAEEERGGESWSPCMKNMEKVIVTDITSNSLTVTIKESSTDKGFFRDNR